MKFINPLKPKIMGILKRKTCSISGKRFKANSENFYANASASDGLHPYHKSFDNFRRSTGANVAQCRKLVNLINA
tara:strand:- start:942 stop:1166 length:225 start_codon:yes stop_codon:yes gene_type:complete